MLFGAVFLLGCASKKTLALEECIGVNDAFIAILDREPEILGGNISIPYTIVSIKSVNREQEYLAPNSKKFFLKEGERSELKNLFENTSIVSVKIFPSYKIEYVFDSKTNIFFSKEKMWVYNIKSGCISAKKDCWEFKEEKISF